MLFRLCLAIALVLVAAAQQQGRFGSRFRQQQQQFQQRRQQFQQQRFQPGVRFPSSQRDRFSHSRVESTTTTRATTTTPAAKTTSTGTLLVPPIPEKCANRPKHWQLGDHWYFYTADEPEFQTFDEKEQKIVGKRYDWLDARNLCRERCMDSISIDSQQEWEMVKNNITSRDIVYIWSSGRLCDFKGCETREDLKPLEKFGWFWSGTNVKLSDTSLTPPGWSEQPWSPTGHLKKPQPDNAEFGINKTPESCLGFLNNVYGDGLKWHDIACYHEKTNICEDSKELLDYARAVNDRDNLRLTIT